MQDAQSSRFLVRPIEARDDAAVRHIIETVMPQFGADGAGFALHDAEVKTMFSAYQIPRACYFVVECNGVVAGGAGIAALVDVERAAKAALVDVERAAKAALVDVERAAKAALASTGAASDVCELRKMYFLPELRGLGAGKVLMQTCLDAARQYSYREVYLETLTGMDAAVKLYERTGFKRLNAPMGATGHFGCDRFYSMAL